MLSRKANDNGRAANKTDNNLNMINVYSQKSLTGHSGLFSASQELTSTSFNSTTSNHSLGEKPGNCHSSTLSLGSDSGEHSPLLGTKVYFTLYSFLHGFFITSCMLYNLCFMYYFTYHFTSIFQFCAFFLY